MVISNVNHSVAQRRNGMTLLASLEEEGREINMKSRMIGVIGIIKVSKDTIKEDRAIIKEIK